MGTQCSEFFSEVVLDRLVLMMRAAIAKTSLFIARHWLLTLFLLFTLWVAHKVYRFFVYVDPGSVMVTSVSSDGHYAVTSDSLKRIILWDLQRHKARLIANKANIYSAYFIKHSDKFIWQDLAHNRVYVEDVQGHIIKSFQPGFPSYGQVMSTDLKYYIASDIDFNLFVISQDKTVKLIERNDGGFLGAGKLLNLVLTGDDKYLLTAGVGGLQNIVSLEKQKHHQALDNIQLWDYKTLTPLRQYLGNESKETATISPDDKYIVGGDEGGGTFVWHLATGKRLFRLDDLHFGRNLHQTKHGWVSDKTGLIPRPKSYGWRIDMAHSPYYKETLGPIDTVQAIKFIDSEHYLRLTHDTSWAILYKITNRQPIKYIYLGKDPYPSAADYSADESLDTSFQAHVLVTGQYNHDGIIVYYYDPKAQTLTRVWAPSAPNFLAKWFWIG